MERKVTYSSLYLLISLGVAVLLQILLLIILEASQPIPILLHKGMFSLLVKSNLHKDDPLFIFSNMVGLINHDIISQTNESRSSYKNETTGLEV